MFCGGVCEVCADAAVVLWAGRKESGQGGCKGGGVELDVDGGCAEFSEHGN